MGLVLRQRQTQCYACWVCHEVAEIVGYALLRLDDLLPAEEHAIASDKYRRCSACGGFVSLHKSKRRGYRRRWRVIADRQLLEEPPR